jgi:hypothetical protein
LAKTTSQIIGACGEHYVAAFLSRHGLLVALPRAGVKGSDLFVADADLGRPLRIQVKTGTQAYGKYKGELIYSWDTSEPEPQHCNETTWYAYVWLNEWPQKPNLPEVFFVPSALVAACLEKEREANAGKKAWRSFFWMGAEEAKNHEGENGLKLLIDAMRTDSAHVGGHIV